MAGTASKKRNAPSAHDSRNPDQLSGFSRVFHPGEPVPSPGTYLVYHRRHRAMHPTKIRFSVFPRCGKCGDNVRFVAAEDMPRKSTILEWLRRDPDFEQTLNPKRKKRVRSA